MVDEIRRHAHERCELELNRLLKMEKHVFTQDSSYQKMLGEIDNHALGKIPRLILTSLGISFSLCMQTSY